MILATASLYFTTALSMSHKRKHTDTVDGEKDASSFKKHKSFKRRKDPSHHDEPKVESASSLKSRLRNLTRLLEHAKDKMPANVRNERERELEACKHELAEKLAADREADFRNKLIGKYHHIRFFGKPIEHEI
jgi:hypothetical protein